MNLESKVAIVTGASSGIGAAAVKALLKLGMKVVGFSRRKEKIESLVDNHNGKLFALSIDVTKPQEILNGFDWVTKNIGPIYVLINNAGIFPRSSVLKGNHEEWKQIIDTNFMSYAIATKEAVKIMKENDIDGYIININSVVGYYDLRSPYSVMYRSSKIALRTMTENVRLELARMNSKIRITTLGPGFVKTGIISAGFGQKISDDFFGKVPALVSEDIGDTILYLLSTPIHVHVSEMIVRPTGEDFNLVTSEFRDLYVDKINC